MSETSFFTLDELQEISHRPIVKVTAGKNWIYATLDSGVTFKIRNWKSIEGRSKPKLKK